MQTDGFWGMGICCLLPLNGLYVVDVNSSPGMLFDQLLSLISSFASFFWFPLPLSAKSPDSSYTGTVRWCCRLPPEKNTGAAGQIACWAHMLPVVFFSFYFSKVFSFLFLFFLLPHFLASASASAYKRTFGRGGRPSRESNSGTPGTLSLQNDLVLAD